MTSKAKKTKAIRKWKDKPNKANLKADIKRNQKNIEILRELAEKDKEIVIIRWMVTHLFLRLKIHSEFKFLDVGGDGRLGTYKA